MATRYHHGVLWRKHGQNEDLPLSSGGIILSVLSKRKGERIQMAIQMAASHATSRRLKDAIFGAHAVQQSQNMVKNVL